VSPALNAGLRGRFDMVALDIKSKRRTRMKKKLVLTAIAVLIVFSILTTLVLAEGPTNAGGKRAAEAAEEWGFPFLYNPMAGLVITPEGAEGYDPDTGEPIVIRFGTATTIEEDGVTIDVSEIPKAVYNENTGEWDGTWVMLKIGPTWTTYKFWLNGAGTVTIKYTYDDGTSTIDEATEFIFFKTKIDGDGWEKIILQAYK